MGKKKEKKGKKGAKRLKCQWVGVEMEELTSGGE